MGLNKVLLISPKGPKIRTAEATGDTGVAAIKFVAERVCIVGRSKLGENSPVGGLAYTNFEFGLS